MPISPDECKRNFEESDKKDLEQLQTQVDSCLRNHYYGEPHIIITHMKPVNKRVMDKFIANYKAVGWVRVEFKSVRSLDQRDPDTTTITLCAYQNSGNIFER